MQLIGHKKIFDRLKKDTDAGTLHHAQLFIGPKAVGKTKLALSLITAMQGASENVILKKQIYEGVDADTILLLDDGESLPIEKIRNVIARSHQSSFRPYLIFLIENIGRMELEALNTLLKTLEEPNSRTVFFLTAHSEEDVIDTIRSRSHITHFHTVNDSILREACGDNVYVDQLVMFAMGRPGKLMRLIEDPEYFEVHQNIHQDIIRFLESPTQHAAFALTRMYEKHEQLQEMLDILLHRVRTYALSGKRPPVLMHLDCPTMMEQVEEVKHDLSRNVNKKLLLENLLLPFAP